MNAAKKRGRKITRHALTAAPLTVGSPTLTVGEIVEQLGAVTSDSAAALSERIRHWTREGLLVPVAQHHAGTGRHRRYGLDSSYDAAVLDALASAGLHLVSRPYIRDVLRHARAALHKCRQAIGAGSTLPPLFLVISQEPTHLGREPTVSIHEGVVNPPPGAEVMIAVNLSQLFLRGLRVSQHDQNAGSKQGR